MHGEFVEDEFRLSREQHNYIKVSQRQLAKQMSNDIQCLTNSVVTGIHIIMCMDSDASLRKHVKHVEVQGTCSFYK